MLYERADDAVNRVDADESIDAVDDQRYKSLRMKHIDAVNRVDANGRRRVHAHESASM